jgi:hypothetical protein
MSATPEDRTPIGPRHYTELDDSGFIEAVASARRELEHTPDDAVNRADLEAIYREMNRDLDDRARALWRAAS